MFDFLANPEAPLLVLVFIGGLAAGFYWGSSATCTRIGKDLSYLGRTRLDEHLFTGQYIGYAPDVADEDDDDEDDDGDPKTVEDLLTGNNKNAAPDIHRVGRSNRSSLEHCIDLWRRLHSWGLRTFGFGER